MNRKIHGELYPKESAKSDKKAALRSFMLLVLAFITTGIMAQEVRITGNVIFATDRDPIIGANVIVEGTTNGTITDFDGNFTLDVPVNSTVVISYIGCVPQKLNVTKQEHFTILLNEDTQNLEEIVVVGYGSQKKVNLTGSVTQVDSKVLESRPITTTSGGLQGVVPNLRIAPKSGQPFSSDADLNINIRGTTSINGGGPLVLVDGVEMSMDLVNPNDIANVTVLKDAAASAIYGVRAAFGVILITTKTAGTDQRTTVSYSGNFSVSTPTVLPEMVKTSWEHAEFNNMAMRNAGLNAMYDDDRIAKMKAYDSNPGSNPEYEVINGQFYYYGFTDWRELMLRKVTPAHTHNVNISGGTEKTKFYTSVGYVAKEGMYKINPDNYDRLNTRLNVENQTTDWMKLGFRILYNYTHKDTPHNYKNNPWHQMIFSTPTQYAGQWKKDPRYPELDGYDGRYFDDQNPISLLDKGGRDINNQHDVWLTATADFKILEGWNAHVDFSYNINNDRTSKHKKAIKMIRHNFTETYGDTSDNSYTMQQNTKDYYSFNAYTDYEKTFAQKHYFKAMAGFNQELTKYQSFEGTRKGMLTDDVPSLSLGAGEQTVLESGYQWALRGGFFRLNYIYDNRYLLEVNGRYDGTSRFPKDDRYVFLPSFSGAWRLSEEAFMQNTRDYVDNIKLRLSYGVLGNQLLSTTDWTGNAKYYPYIPFMSSGPRTSPSDPGYWLFGNSQSLFINPAGLVTNDLTWEKAATTNVGIDFTVLHSKLDVSFDWYQRVTSDMLAKIQYPEVLGASAPPSNLAALRTRGWELSVNWRDRIGKDFRYDIGLVLSDSQAEITKYENPTGSIGTYSTPNYYKGRKIGEIWGYESLGLFQTQEQLDNHADQSFIGSNWGLGDVMYADRNNDGKVNKGDNTIDDPGDQIIIGNETPRYMYGVSVNMDYKGFFLNMFMQGVGKQDFYPTSEAFWPVATQYYNTQAWFIKESWTPENTGAYFARPIARNTKNTRGTPQTRFLQDASYMRMKNITFGYNFPSRWIQPIGLSRAQLYLSGENLFEITNTKGSYDPEAIAQKGSMLYPFQRTYSIGVNVTF